MKVCYHFDTERGIALHRYCGEVQNVEVIGERLLRREHVEAYSQNRIAIVDLRDIEGALDVEDEKIKQICERLDGLLSSMPDVKIEKKAVLIGHLNRIFFHHPFRTLDQKFGIRVKYFLTVEEMNAFLGLDAGDMIHMDEDKMDCFTDEA